MNHIRYCRNLMTAFYAVVFVAFIVFPVLAIPFILLSRVCSATIFLSAGFLLTSILWCFYGRSVNITMQFYTWYVFKGDCVIICTLFHQKTQVQYADYADVGVGYYSHGLLNTTVGSKVWFIYLADHKIDSKYKDRMNMLKPSQGCLKVGFRKKTYQYLLNNLPTRQAKMLERSYADREREYHRR